MMLHVKVISIAMQILCVIKQFHHRFVHVNYVINIIQHCENVVGIRVQYVIEQRPSVWIMLNVVMAHVNVQISLYLMKIEYVVHRYMKYV